MRRIDVHSHPNPYPVFVGTGKPPFYRRLKKILGDASPILLSSRPVVRACLGTVERRLKRKFRRILIPDGERAKNLKTVEQVYRDLIRLRADRQTPLLLLGGGVVGDLGGFVAATYLRGIPYIQLPTTLVAQIDSSVGGKVGVDLPEGKNLVGSFYPPAGVFTDVSHLARLPLRDFRSGLAEALKYGIIRDPSLFDWILSHRDRLFRRDLPTLERLVTACVRHKGEVVSRDEKEGGLRRILNFGHTFGHALEKMTSYRRYRHGEAIAIGMLAATTVSVGMGYAPPSLAVTVRRGLEKLGLPARIPRYPGTVWENAIRVDKKGLKGKIHFVFLRRLGSVRVEPVTIKTLIKFL